MAKIIFYTNRNCPWAARVHVALKELKLHYDEVIIDLGKPREPWYLEINPRGLVPALKYSDDSIKDEVITESSVASHFLADLGPSHLLPAQASGSKTALAKARSNFFVDTYVTKLLPKYHAFVFAADGSGPDAKTKDYLDTLEREIEPLLKDANPFFGGSQELTLTEVLTAPFILHINTLSNNKVLPIDILEGHKKLPNYSKWEKAVLGKESVRSIFEEKDFVAAYEERMRKRRADASAK